jgi:CBS domain-containing membrane protein
MEIDMRAADVMTEDPVTIRATSTVGEAVRLLDQLAIGHLPVLDDDGALVGMLSDRDLRGARGARIVDVMSSNVIEANADDELGAVAQLMIDHHIGAVPIVDGGGALVGIVSYVDILQTIADDGDAVRAHLDEDHPSHRFEHELTFVDGQRVTDGGGRPIAHVVPAPKPRRRHEPS